MDSHRKRYLGNLYHEEYFTCIPDLLIHTEICSVRGIRHSKNHVTEEGNTVKDDTKFPPQFNFKGKV